MATKVHGIWVVTVSPDNKWYESLNLLLRQPPEFFDKNTIRIIPDRDAGYYRIRYRPTDVKVVWPTASTEQLLGEALGAGRFITTVDHPVYADLVAGRELA